MEHLPCIGLKTIAVSVSVEIWLSMLFGIDFERYECDQIDWSFTIFKGPFSSDLLIINRCVESPEFLIQHKDKGGKEK